MEDKGKDATIFLENTNVDSKVIRSSLKFPTQKIKFYMRK